MKVEHILTLSLEEVEQIRQATLSNIKEVSFEFEDIILTFGNTKPNEDTMYADGEVSWLNQEH